MFSKEIMEIISTTDSCIGFLRERRVLRTLPPLGPECNERATEEKDSAVNGSSAELLSGYLDEYLWRERYGKNRPTAFENKLSHTAEIYPEDRKNQPDL